MESIGAAAETKQALAKEAEADLSIEELKRRLVILKEEAAASAAAAAAAAAASAAKERQCLEKWRKRENEVKLERERLIAKMRLARGKMLESLNQQHEKLKQQVRPTGWLELRELVTVSSGSLAYEDALITRASECLRCVVRLLDDHLNLGGEKTLELKYGEKKVTYVSLVLEEQEKQAISEKKELLVNHLKLTGRVDAETMNKMNGLFKHFHPALLGKDGRILPEQLQEIEEEFEEDAALLGLIRRVLQTAEDSVLADLSTVPQFPQDRSTLRTQLRLAVKLINYWDLTLSTHQGGGGGDGEKKLVFAELGMYLVQEQLKSVAGIVAGGVHLMRNQLYESGNGGAE